MNHDSQTVVLQKSETNGFAIAALVVGLIGVVLNFVFIIPYFLGILAIIFGVVGLRKKTGRGMAISGIILGVVTYLLKFLFWLVFILLA